VEQVELEEGAMCHDRVGSLGRFIECSDSVWSNEKLFTFYFLFRLFDILNLQRCKYVVLLYFIIILCTSCYSVSSVSYVSLRLCTGHHLQSTIYNLHCSLSFWYL
jgi:hypothetical protein